MTNKPKICDCDLVNCSCKEHNPQTIGKLLGEFDKQFEGLDGKINYGVEAVLKDFLTHALHAYEEATKVEGIYMVKKYEASDAGWLAYEEELTQKRKAFWGE